MSDSTPIYYERVIAELLGISRPDLTYLRKEHLKKNEGWRMEGRDVVLTQAGLETILIRAKASLNTAAGTDAIDFSAALVSPAEGKKEEGAATDPPPAPAEAPAKPELAVLTVTRCYPNYRLLQARTEAGDLVDVRVRHNKNFVPRMTLKARLNGAGKYEMEGRCPRTRGRY